MSPIALYALLVLGIIVLPGMDMAFVAASALVDGRRAGLAAVAGIVAGGVLHWVLAGVGLGLLLQAWPAAFNALLLAGAGYIGWLGLGQLRQPGALLSLSAGVSRSRLGTFCRAAATCLLNPKAYVFMLAVVPAFLRPDQGPLLPQVALLAAITAGTQALVYGAVVLGAAGLRSRLQHSATLQAAAARAVGLLLVATAIWTLFNGWSRS